MALKNARDDAETAAANKSKTKLNNLKKVRLINILLSGLEELTDAELLWVSSVQYQLQYCNYLYLPNCLGQKTAERPFGHRVELPPAHLSTTHSRGFTFTLPFLSLNIK